MHSNKTEISGKVVSITNSHKVDGISHYRYEVQVPRKSGNFDVVPFVVPEDTIAGDKITNGDYITSSGEMRTLNREVNGKNRLFVFNYTNHVEKINTETFNRIEDKNIVLIDGYIVKDTKYRETSKGRKITELTIAHNRPYRKASYVPCIAWGTKAEFSKDLKVSNQVSAVGRFQSREYTTRSGDKRTAYEVSINSMDILGSEK